MPRFTAEVQVNRCLAPKAETTQSGLVTLVMPMKGYAFGQKDVKHHFMSLSLPDADAYRAFTKRFPVGTRFISVFDVIRAPTPVVVKDDDGEETIMKTATGETVMRSRIAFAPGAPYKITREIARIEGLKLDPSLTVDGQFDLAALAEPAVVAAPAKAA